MKNNIVFLIRHGEIDNPKKVFYGRSINLHLNNIGKDQIKTIAKKIKKSGYLIGRIYTSPLQRAIESSKIIANIFGIEDIIIDEDLIDVDIPAFIGKPLKIRKEIHKNGTDEYNEEFAKKGNEGRENIAKRMIKAFDKIVKENKGRTVAILSHGDPLRFLLYKIENPKMKVLPMNVLVKTDYPKKGEAVKIVLDNNDNFIDKEFIK